MPRLSNEYQAVLRSALSSRRLAAIGKGSELTYFHLLLASDHWGRYWADPAEVLAGAFTLRFANGTVGLPEIGAQLDELASFDLIRRYEAEGAYCLELTNYFDPTPIPRRRPRFPIPPWAVVSTGAHASTPQRLGGHPTQ